jgi:phosphoglycolate phosphatase/putative hydrolase of the HAD superfamily
VKIYRLPETLGCIIFDIDSTLYTHDEYAREQIDIQIRHFAKLKGYDNDDAREMIERFRENHQREHGEKLSLGNTLTHFGIPISESVRWRELLLEPREYLSADPKLAHTLAELSAMSARSSRSARSSHSSQVAEKLKLVAVTNNPVLPALKTLKALGVEAFFPVLIGLDTTGVSKPHRRPFLEAAQAAGVPVEQCLSVGDRYDIDIALPLVLGMGGILVDGVEDVYRLPELLG